MIEAAPEAGTKPFRAASKGRLALAGSPPGPSRAIAPSLAREESDAGVSSWQPDTTAITSAPCCLMA